MSRLVRTLSAALLGITLFSFVPGKKVLAATPGWNQIKGEWYYYEEDGKTKHKGWLYSGKQWYYFDSDGVMVHDRIIVDVDYKGAYLFDSAGHMVKNKWVKWHIAGVGDDDKTYYTYQYFGSDGLSYSGWKKISKKWYYFEGAHPAGNVAYGTREIEGKTYVFTTSGTLAGSGWVKSPYKDDNGNYHYYYSSSGGIAALGWKQISGKWYYFDKTGDSGDIGYRLVGKQTIDGKTYIFDKNGVMKTGWYQDPDTKNWCYLKKDGSFAVSDWVTDGGKKYYFNAKSFMVTGKVKIGNDYYLFAENGALITGWYQDPATKNWCYLKKDGSFTVSDWVTDGGKKYYFNAKSFMVTGKVKIGDDYYWFADNGAMITGWHQNESGYWFYLRKNGVLAVGWLQINGNKYFFDKNGAMFTGIRSVDGKLFFFAESGALKSQGWYLHTNGYWYYVKDDGTVTAGEWLNQSGKWYCFRSSGAMYKSCRTMIDGVYYIFDDNGVCTNYPQ